MVAALDQLCQQASDRPDFIVSLVRHHGTGRAGRPRILFDPQFLSFALEVRGPTDVAKVFGCSSRTVRRRAVDLKLLPVGQAPFQDIVQENGTVARMRVGAPKHTRHSNISDDDLNAVMWEILRDFPHFGRRMIDGRLRSLGIIVPRERIMRSYLRVHGPPSAFNRQPIVRREYFVAGVNSLWHHDGQHGKYISTLSVSLLHFLPKASSNIKLSSMRSLTGRLASLLACGHTTITALPRLQSYFTNPGLRTELRGVLEEITEPKTYRSLNGLINTRGQALICGARKFPPVACARCLIFTIGAPVTPELSDSGLISHGGLAQSGKIFS
jgi:hypothetical protein